MTKKVPAAQSGGEPGRPGMIDAEAVRTFIEAHPDFLQENPELLDILTTPTRSNGKVVDLQHFMVERQKSENERLKNAYAAAIAVTRLNQSVQSRVHTAVLSILGAGSFESLIQIVTTDLAVQLQVDVVTIGAEAGDTAIPKAYMQSLRSLPTGWVDQTIGSNQAVLLSADVVGDTVLFGSAAGLVRSQALARLHVSPDAPIGVLALGSRRPESYAKGQGTELLSFLARALEITIRQWLNLPH